MLSVVFLSLMCIVATSPDLVDWDKRNLGYVCDAY